MCRFINSRDWTIKRGVANRTNFWMHHNLGTALGHRRSCTTQYGLVLFPGFLSFCTWLPRPYDVLVDVVTWASLSFFAAWLPFPRPPMGGKFPNSNRAAWESVRKVEGRFAKQQKSWALTNKNFEIITFKCVHFIWKKCLRLAHVSHLSTRDKKFVHTILKTLRVNFFCEQSIDSH